MTRACIVMVLLTFLGISGQARAQKEEEAEAKRLGKAMIESARAGLQVELKFFRVRELFWWSQRILFAELEVGEAPAERMTAFQDHLKRCREYEGRVVAMKQQGQLPLQDVMDAKFFRARAEYWLAEEKLRQSQKKGNKRPAPAPPVEK